MSSSVAALVYSILIAIILWCDHDRKARTCLGLWFPIIWLSLACSRPLGSWLQSGSGVVNAEQVMDGSPIDRAVYMVLLAAGLVVLVARCRRLQRILPSMIPILVFFLYCALSLLWSDYPDVGFKRWTKALGDLVMVLIVVTDVNPLAALKRLLARTSYLLIPLSILFIKYYPQLGVQYGPWGGKAGYAGVTNNKNSLGSICLCFGVATLWRVATDYKGRGIPGRMRRLVGSGIFLSMVLWLFMTINAMTSLSTFIMAGVLLFAVNMRLVARRPAVVHALIGMMIFASVAVLFLGASPTVLQDMGRDPTLTDRTEVWGLLLSLVHHPIIGTGFESFWLGPRLNTIWERYWWRPNEAHNGYLEIYLNLGWTGILLLVVVIVAGYWAAFRAWQKKMPAGDLRLAYLLVGLVFNFTEAAFFRMLAPVWIFLLFGMVGFPAISPRKLIRPAQSFLTRREHEPVTSSGRSLASV